MYNHNMNSGGGMLMRGLRKLLSSVLVAGVVLGTFSTGVSAGFYTADEEGLKDIKIITMEIVK